MSLLLDALKRAEAARHDTAPVLSLATDLPVAVPNDLPLPLLAMFCAICWSSRLV